VKVLEVATQREVSNLLGHRAYVVPVGFLGQGSTLITVDDEGFIGQWDTASWRLRMSARVSGRVVASRSALTDAPNTGFLLLSLVGRERIGWLTWWNLSSSKEEGSILAHRTQMINQPAVSPDGQLLATTGADEYVRLWSAAHRTPLGVLRGQLLGTHSAAFSPDGTRLASGSNGREAVKLWDLATRQELTTLAGSGIIFHFTRFSPDGNLIVAINWDDQAHVWRAPSWAEIEAVEQAGPAADPKP